MVYPPLDLRLLGLVIGALLIAAHGWALFREAAVQDFLRGFARAKVTGGVLLVAAAAWFWLMILNMDLGEFSTLRPWVLGVIPLGCLATLVYGDFLAVRSLGMLLLLAAEPVLEAAWMRPEATRLVLVVLAYGWIVAGLFWVGMPYLLRDQIAWVLRAPARWRAGCYAGLAYGLLVIICSATLRR